MPPCFSLCMPVVSVCLFLYNCLSCLSICVERSEFLIEASQSVSVSVSVSVSFLVFCSVLFSHVLFNISLVFILFITLASECQSLCGSVQCDTIRYDRTGDFQFVSPDIDECCIPEKNECHAMAVCTNTERSYVCRCKNGYRGNGKMCGDEQHLSNG